MNKLLMLVVLVLLVLASAVGLRNLTASQTAGRQEVASTSNPMPAAPYLVASTSNPMPAAPYLR
ncbi:MAG: hypothetical protein ACYDDI_04080 [Candidatus Acidiferrales bacterium]